AAVEAAELEARLQQREVDPAVARAVEDGPDARARRRAAGPERLQDAVALLRRHAGISEAAARAAAFAHSSQNGTPLCAPRWSAATIAATSTSLAKVVSAGGGAAVCSTGRDAAACAAAGGGAGASTGTSRSSRGAAGARARSRPWASPAARWSRTWWSS